MKNNFYILLLASVGLVMAACSRNPKTPGRIYMPDMTYSNASETYSQGTIANEDGIVMSARKPVHGTIPRGFIPSDEAVRGNEAFLASYLSKENFTGLEENWQAESDRAGATIKNPLADSEYNLAEGKRLYNIQCTPCHGEKGDGQGQLVVLPDGGDGPYTAVPPDYKKRLTEINDGKIFYSVSYGKGMMGGYRNGLTVTERWQVIQYIKSLAGVTGATAVASVAKQDSVGK